MPSTAAPTKTAVLTAFRRDALLAAARRVFGQYGFERATVERIAREAGVAKGTVYLYYASKRAIYWAALAAGIEELHERTRTRVAEAANLRELVSAFIATKVEYFDERRDFFRIYVSELGRRLGGPLYQRPEIQPLYVRQIRALEQAIARAVKQGEIRAVDARETASAIFDLTRGLITRRLLAGRRRPAAGEGDALVQRGWQGLERRGGGRALAGTRGRTVKGTRTR
jgi:AcrR family transcriptional regulator